MAAQTQPKMNIYEKLMVARTQFGLADKTKSGKNSHAEFMYYELSDIVPIATKIFTELGLSYIVSFEDGMVKGTLLDWSTDQHIVFSIPFVAISEPAKFRMNEIQAMGGAITYFRRYMYMLVLDIVEPDAFDCSVGEPVKETPKPKAPIAQEKREEIKEKVTTITPATEESVDKLKAILKKYKAKGSKEEEEEIQKIAMKTASFTKITETDCQKLIKKYGELV